MKQRPQNIVAPAQPLRVGVRPVVFVSPEGDAVATLPVCQFTPGLCMISIGKDAWYGVAVRIGQHFIWIETENGPGVFDLREVELFAPF